MANILTISRIPLSVLLLCTHPLSCSFYILYGFCGLTDVVDGFIARKTGSASETGAKLDTAADFVFVVVCLIKLLPVIELPIHLLIGTLIIALIKIINIISGFIVQKKFVAVHTILNKVTGAMLFVLPLTVSFVDLRYSGSIVCAVATFAAIQEGHFIRMKRK
ncbi:MAG: CDP-alcohol phosphatidyltransferase family protein [Oscillospiraceae bacterium]|nr:CDP-alcohol phosphatidyltransferase family protein [Oscillospiraceae bacterium]